MLEKKRKLADALKAKNVKVMYGENQSRSVFVAGALSAMETMFMIKESGCDITEVPEPGEFKDGTEHVGYWCLLAM